MTRHAANIYTLLCLCLGLVLFAAAASAGPSMSVHEAYRQAQKGEVLLVDIRSPAEWRETGVAPVARPISMHEPGFFEKLNHAVDGDRGKTIAVICAAGGRSTWMQIQLLARGYTNVIDVPEGMVGGSNGPGWIKTGLPTKPYLE